MAIRPRHIQNFESSDSNILRCVHWYSARGHLLILGHIPLPSWIKFSADNITFFGDAPEVFSKIAPPQYFTITLIASTHRGFESASQSFDVVIGAHSLT